MIRPLRSILFTAAIGLVLNTAAVVHCHAYPFGKHGQTVYVVPTTTAVTTVGSAPVMYTTGSAPATYSVGSAPATYTTGSAPPTIIYQAQAATGGAPATGAAPMDSACALSVDDQNDIIVQLREVLSENKDSAPDARRQALTDKANELVAAVCEKEVDAFSSADKQLVRSLVRQALSQRTVGSAPAMAGYGYAPGTVTAPAVQYVQYPQYVQPPMILVPVQLYAPTPPPSHHHFFCRCQSCAAKRGY